MAQVRARVSGGTGAAPIATDHPNVKPGGSAQETPRLGSVDAALCTAIGLVTSFIARPPPAWSPSAPLKRACEEKR